MPTTKSRRSGRTEWGPLTLGLFVVALFLGACFYDRGTGTVARGSDQLFRVTPIAESLDGPWSLAFLPGGDLLVTEKSGQLRRVRDGVLDSDPIAGVPEVADVGQGGLLDVILDPEFADNQRIYLSYAAGNLEDGYGTEILSAVLGNKELTEVNTIFVAEPKSLGGRHFGSRFAFDSEGHLYATIGDRGNRDSAQDLTTHTGSVIRINTDGTVPKDNPFVGKIGARPEIFSYGHRNPQGLVIDPLSERIWLHEHGPQGGDEINIVRRGGNYGWPVVTFGEEYGGGTIGEGTTRDGMIDPAWVWVPSIAPSGLAYYSGDAIPGLKGSLLVGALKFRLLANLRTTGANVDSENRWLENEIGRVRDVRVGPDGLVYLLSDSGNLVRLEPLAP